MSWQTGYLMINALVLPAWALLVFAPRARLTRNWVHSAIWPILLGLIYIAFLSAALFFGQAAPGAGMSDLAGVMALFDHPNGVLTGWTHYLAFDLFVGAWIGRDAQRQGLAHLFTVPCLLATLMFGPVGLVLYFLLRIVNGKGISVWDS
jgi:hypothetical protein